MSDEPVKPVVGDGGGPRPKTRAGDRRGAQPGQQGQPAFVPTEAQRIEVRTLASCFVEMEHMATKTGISETTLRKHFAKEIAEGRANTIASVSAKIVQAALEGCKKSQRLVAEKKAGWNTRVEHTGAGGGPIEYRNLSESEVDARLRELEGRYQVGSDARH